MISEDTDGNNSERLFDKDIGLQTIDKISYTDEYTNIHSLTPCIGNCDSELGTHIYKESNLVTNPNLALFNNQITQNDNSELNPSYDLDETKNLINQDLQIDSQNINIDVTCLDSNSPVVLEKLELNNIKKSNQSKVDDDLIDSSNLLNKKTCIVDEDSINSSNDVSFKNISYNLTSRLLKERYKEKDLISHTGNQNSKSTNLSTIIDNKNINNCNDPNQNQLKTPKSYLDEFHNVNETQSYTINILTTPNTMSTPTKSINKYDLNTENRENQKIFLDINEPLLDNSLNKTDNSSYIIIEPNISISNTMIETYQDQLSFQNSAKNSSENFAKSMLNEVITKYHSNKNDSVSNKCIPWSDFLEEKYNTEDQSNYSDNYISQVYDNNSQSSIFDNISENNYLFDTKFNLDNNSKSLNIRPNTSHSVISALEKQNDNISYDESSFHTYHLNQECLKSSTGFSDINTFEYVDDIIDKENILYSVDSARNKDNLDNFISKKHLKISGLHNSDDYNNEQFINTNRSSVKNFTKEAFSENPSNLLPEEKYEESLSSDIHPTNISCDESVEWKLTTLDIYGEDPAFAGGHTCTVSGDLIVCFGGQRFKDGEYKCHNDVALLDLENGIWLYPKHIGIRPNPRYYHTAAYIKNKVIFFGGCQNVNMKHRYFNDLYALQVTKKAVKWYKGDCANPISARAGHSMCVFDNSLIIFGGVDSNKTYTNDVFKLNIDTLEWELITPCNQKPPGRAFHAGLMAGHRLVISGGFNENSEERFYGDFMAMDLKSKMWLYIDVRGITPSPRFHHVLIAKNARLLSIGGWTQPLETTQDTDTLFEFIPAMSLWRKLDVQLPARIYGHTCISLGSGVLIVGGWSESEPIREYYLLHPVDI